MAKQKLFSVTIHDCRVDVFRSGGKGGQNQNKVNSGVRIVHEPSGAVAESREERDQLVNKKRAWKRLCESKEFQIWLKIETARRMGTLVDIEAEIDRSMHHVKTESRDKNGRWVEGLTNPVDDLPEKV